MGDILQILIIIGIIIFGVVKQLSGSGEEKKKQQRRPPVTIPDADRKETESIKESPRPFPSYDDNPPAPFTKTDERRFSPPPIVPEEPDNDNPEFDIHSAEEVRRGILWSEILDRKY